MTRSEFELFLNGGIGICAAMMIIVLLRTRSRGLAAYLLSIAFLFLGLVLLAIREAWPQAVLVLFGVAVAACLFGDFAYRSARRQGDS